MPAKSEVKTGFWITTGVILAVVVVGIVYGFVMKKA